MWKRIALVLACLLILGAVGVGLQMVLTRQHGIKTLEDVTAEMKALKAEAEMMEREAITEQERLRGDQYALFLESLIIPNDEASPTAPPPSPPEIIELATVYLAENPDLDPQVVTRIEELIAKLRASLDTGQR